MTQDTSATKDTQRLQRAIIDGLEDVKAQDIKVFNTEHLSPLFERVIVASGTSNRQTKALASSVRDAVREAGFPKPRIEGEENGEWIIVDCGQAVAHIMQPAIRTYYHLEEIWGDKPVRLKFGASKPATATASPEPVKAPAKKGAAAIPTLRRSSAAKTAVKQAEQEAKAAKAPVRKAGAKSAARKSPARTPAKAPVRAAAGKAPARAPAKAPVAAAPSKAPAKAPVRVTAGKAPAKAPARAARASAPPAKAPARTAARSPARAPVSSAKKAPIGRSAAPAKTGIKAPARKAPSKSASRKA